MSEFILGDCIEGMKRFPDKYFDLAIVDPPYGGGAKEPDANGIGGGGADFEQRRRSRFGGWFANYHISDEDGKVEQKVPDKRGYL